MEVNSMVEFRLMETLLYKSENNEVEGEFLIGQDTLWSSQKIVAKFLKPVLKTYQSISVK